MAEYIEREVAIDFVNNYTPNIDGETTIQCVKTALKNAPTADVVPVVRCKDCKRARPLIFKNFYFCRKYRVCRKTDDYCSYGERKVKNERNKYSN